jgi:spermidine synthase
MSVSESTLPPLDTQTPAVEPMREAALRHPALIVFITNTCLMLVQLVASRLVAPIVGVSLYTWTSIIGVMLAGISLGNYVGGRLADRGGSRRLLGWLLLLTALSLMLVLVIFYSAGVGLGLPPIAGVPLVPRMVLFFAGLFFLPSVMLGTLSPVVIKLAVRDLAQTGSVMGRIASASTLGNLFGTFATGFVLISLFGTRAVLFGALITLAVLALWVGDFGRGRVIARIASLGLAASLVVVPLTPLAEFLRGNCLRETDYFCIRVRSDDRNGKTYQVLTLDRLVHSYVALDDPLDLRYQYEQVGAEVADYLFERDKTITSYFIGGGGYSLPKFIEVRHPGSRIDVAEIDPGVTEVVHTHLGLSRDTSIRTFNEDARLHLTTLAPEVKYNFVLGDAFNDFSVPYHLTTHEFNQVVRSHMSDDGIYMLNLIDGNTLPFVGAFLRTLKQTFPHVVLITSGGTLFGASRNTFVVLASPQPIDIDHLRNYRSTDNAKNIDAWLVKQAEVDQLIASDTLVLTDDFVPTDRLLAPMFEASEAVK